MQEPGRFRPQIRLTAMLLIAFLFVGATIGYVTMISISRSQEKAQCEALGGYAALLGGQVTGDQYLAALGQNTGANRLSAITNRIRSLAKHFSGVQSVYIVRRNSPRTSGKEFSRTTQIYGESIGPDDIPSSATFRRAFATGSPATRLVESADHLPTPVSYIPLVSRQGGTAAVLVIEGQPAVSQFLPANWGSMLWIVCGALLVISLLATSIIARQILFDANQSTWTKSLRAITKAIRNPILEFILVASTIVTLVAGLQAASRWQETGAEFQGLQIKIDRLEDLAKVLDRDFPTNYVSPEDLAQAAGELGLADYALTLTRHRAIGSNKRAVANQIRYQIGEDRFKRDLIREEEERDENTARRTLWVAGLMILGAIILIRVAAGQQSDLVAAEQVSVKLQGAYSQVAENLPIGLFSYQGNALKFTNKVWDQLTNRFPFENRMEALMRSIHPDDATRLREALAEGEKARRPFDIQYRLIGSEGQERSIESRAVPILDTDGHFEYLLGFGLDVTQMVEARNQLEARNKEVSAKNSQLHKALTDIEDNFEAMVHSLVKAVEAKDPYTAGHSERVMGYSVRIGEYLNLPAKHLRILERGALIHDIGKIGIPDALLTKPAALTEEEFSIVKQHPMIGFRMIQGIPIFNECVPIVLWHHERLDGKGYPDRLSGDQIPLLVRITAVADCFDAMTSNRAYRKGMDVERALNLLRADGANGALDPEIVEVLVKVVNRDGLLWQATEINAA